MKKIFFFSGVILLVAGLAVTPAFGGDLSLNIKGYRCVDEGVLIRYSITNERNFDRNNVYVLFKVLVDGKPLACREIKTFVPKGADGSQIEEVILESQCEGKSFKLVSAIIQNTARYKIEEWFSGCP